MVLSGRLEIRDGESITAFNVRRMRAEFLEEAAAECERHATFLREEAHAGGDWKHLMDRHQEAVYLANQIRKLAIA
jgi:hypothetical protein